MSRAAKKSTAPRLDAANLAGITTLMNPQHVKAGMNLQDAEKAIMGKRSSTKLDSDPVRLYTAELNRLAEDLGIDLLDDAAPTVAAAAAPPSTFSRPPPPQVARPPPPRRPMVTNLIDDIDFGTHASASESASESASDAASESASGSSCDCDSECESACSCECHCDCDSECESACSCECHGDEASESSAMSEDKVDTIIARLETDLGIKTDGSRDKNRHRVHGGTSIPSAHRNVSLVSTNEQERRRHINSVVADIRGETRTTFGVERQ